MIEAGLPTEAVRRLYDRLGKYYDWAAFYEGEAKRWGREALELKGGQRVLNVGCGTGRDQAHVLEKVGGDGLAVGVDVSMVMCRLTRERTGSPVVQADARYLPFAPRTFERLYVAYVLDLMPVGDLPGVLKGFGRLLKHGGRLVVLALTEGIDSLSRAVVGLWKAVYAAGPSLCAGCRPVQVAGLLSNLGFEDVNRVVVVQFGVPTEIVAATPPD